MGQSIIDEIEEGELTRKSRLAFIDLSLHTSFSTLETGKTLVISPECFMCTLCYDRLEKSDWPTVPRLTVHTASVSLLYSMLCTLKCKYCS